jgi:hypothetical protein
MWVPTKPAQVEVLEKYGVKGVKYKNGFPDFSPFAEPHKKYVHQLPAGKWKLSDYQQFKDASLRLAEYLEKHPAAKSRFSADDLEALKRGKTPEKLRWHHRQRQAGDLQLVSYKIHECQHYGGRNSWGGGTGKR